jgi:hypothetical protein
MEFPEPVRAIPPDERQKRISMAGTAFLWLDTGKFFIRALLPVRLSDGHEFHFGVWLEIPEETFKQLWTRWELPEYATMRFDATLANSVPPWNEAIFDAPCVAAVRERDQLPYVESSSQAQLARVLDTPWSRDECEQLLDQVWGRSA